MKNARLRIAAIILGGAVFFGLVGEWVGLLAVVPDLMIVIGFCALVVGRCFRPPRQGWSLSTRRLIGMIMFLVYAAIIPFGFYEFLLCKTPAPLLGWLNVMFMAWMLGYLAWKVFIFPNPPRDDGGGGPRPPRPLPTKGPGNSKKQAVRDVGAPVLHGLSVNK